MNEFRNGYKHSDTTDLRQGIAVSPTQVGDLHIDLHMVDLLLLTAAAAVGQRIWGLCINLLIYISATFDWANCAQAQTLLSGGKIPGSRWQCGSSQKIQTCFENRLQTNKPIRPFLPWQ